MPGRYKHNSGVTVVELILVVVIVAILAGMFVPRYTKEAALKHEVYSTAHDLAADIRYARTLSLGGGTAGNSGKTYWVKLYKVGSATDTWKVFENGNEASPIKSVTTRDNITLNDNSTSSFYFSSSGTPSPFTGGNIDVKDENSAYRWKVSVVRGTGSVTLTEF